MKVKFKRYHYCPICGKRLRIDDTEKEEIAKRILENPYKATSIRCHAKQGGRNYCQALILVKGVIE